MRFILSLFFVFPFTCYSQTTSIGGELDALPFLSGGWYGSVYYHQENWRLRLVGTQTSLPEFAREKGLNSHDLSVAAFIIDYFPDSSSNGWWIGMGGEFWSNAISETGTKETTSFNQAIFTVGGGYVLPLLEWLYINPWIALHVPVSGTNPQNAGTTRVESPLVTFSGSVKMGFRF